MDYNNHNYEQTEFSKALLAGLFAGITATFLSLLYNSYFRLWTGFPLSEMINVSTIIFALVLIVTISGLVFYLFHHYLKKGTVLYQLASLILTAVLILVSLQVQRSSDPVLSMEFRELLLGVISITGICCVFIIPFLFKNDYV
ncbi:MAG: hypothetical protein ABI402_14405 [Ferruginibacter sp.]